MKTIKELEAENKTDISETFKIINAERIKALKDVLGLIDEIIKLSDKDADLWGLEELKSKING